MNIVSKDFVIEMMRRHQLPFFTVYDATGSRKLFDQQDDTKSFDDAIIDLDAVLEAQEPGQIVYVKVSDKTKKEKAGGGDIRKGQYEYRIRCGTKGVGAIKETPGYHRSDNKVFELMDQLKQKELEIIQLKNKQDIADLRKEFEEKLKESPLEKYAPHIISGLSNLFNNGGKSPAAIQGIAGPETVGEPKEDINTKITAAVRRLYKIDKNLHDTLTTLADFAEKDPNKYLSFIPMLKSL